MVDRIFGHIKASSFYRIKSGSCPFDHQGPVLSFSKYSQNTSFVPASNLGKENVNHNGDKVLSHVLVGEDRQYIGNKEKHILRMICKELS